MRHIFLFSLSQRPADRRSRRYMQRISSWQEGKKNHHRNVWKGHSKYPHACRSLRFKSATCIWYHALLCCFGTTVGLSPHLSFLTCIFFDRIFFAKSKNKILFGHLQNLNVILASVFTSITESVCNSNFPSLLNLPRPIMVRSEMSPRALPILPIYDNEPHATPTPHISVSLGSIPLLFPIFSIVWNLCGGGVACI